MQPFFSIRGLSKRINGALFGRKPKSARPPASGYSSECDVRYYEEMVIWADHYFKGDPLARWHLIWSYLPIEVRESIQGERYFEILREARRRFGQPENPVVSVAALTRLIDDLMMENAL